MTICVQLIMVLITQRDLARARHEPGHDLGNVPLFQHWIVLLYGLVALALWHAPIYGWLLLVSGWARRATFLWAVLPLIAVQIFEKIAFSSSHFAAFLKHRLDGFRERGLRFIRRPRGPSRRSIRSLNSPRENT